MSFVRGYKLAARTGLEDQIQLVESCALLSSSFGISKRCVIMGGLSSSVLSVSIKFFNNVKCT